MDVKRKALSDIAEALRGREKDNRNIAAGSVRDLIGAIYAEPNPKKRKKLIKDFTARHCDAADFIAENERLINAEAEAALIGAAVGGTVEEKEVSYKGGRRQEVIKKRHIAPNAALLALLLKNRMPEKYSDNPQTEIEVEDLSEMEDMVYGGEDTAEAAEEKDDTV